MKITVNPNRMELLRLRKRLGLARRGHKLLKDKQEELMRQFMALADRIRTLRAEIEETLSHAHHSFLQALSDMPAPVMEDALSFPEQKIVLERQQVPIMNLRVPRFKVEWEGGKYSYGMVDTAAELDRTLNILSDLLPKMIQMAEIEKSFLMISRELEKTRRRVNALEYILIPTIEDTIRAISDKLSEIERGNLTRLMKVKEIVRAH